MRALTARPMPVSPAGPPRSRWPRWRAGTAHAEGVGMESVTPAPLHEQHRLSDGTVVTLRYIRPDDAPELALRFSQLSLDSRRRRFFAGMSGLSPRMLRYLTEV